MDQDKSVRENLLWLLKGGMAHMSFADMVKDFPMKSMNTVFPHGTYTPWHLIEHIRRTQSDILEFTINEDYSEKEWPKDYWPENGSKAYEKDWEKTVKDFHTDLKSLQKIAEDPKTNLYNKISWGTGQTILRELLLVADHNAYHIGEFAIMRQVMGNWK